MANKKYENYNEKVAQMEKVSVYYPSDIKNGQFEEGGLFIFVPRKIRQAIGFSKVKASNFRVIIEVIEDDTKM